MNEVQERTVQIPPHRMRIIKQNWLAIYTAIVEYGKLQIRLNRRNNTVDLRTCPSTLDSAFLERSGSFIEAVAEGFKIEDAIAIMKYHDVFIESFKIDEVRKLKNGHMNRALGRIIGREGRTKESIENFAKCKFLLLDQRIVILGCPDNIKIAKDAIGRLIQGVNPSSIFNRLRIIANKIKDKYGSIQTIYQDLRNTH